MDWDEVIVGLKADMEFKHKAREQALQLCRQLIQACSKCIKHVHRGQYTEASAILDEARSIRDKCAEALRPHGELYYAGYLQDAEKEFVEAAVTLAMVTGAALPTQAELAVQTSVYLNGAAEAASECRRAALDRMRHGQLDEAERLLEGMVTVYEDLATFDFPDSLTGGLRRTNDALRAVVERTRSDLTLTRVQHDLMEELRAAKSP
ncbi:MAG: haloacid dehalogenase [Armatimonadetes bacterium]|nr:haloacid dehalogenase [Armatimonadota bacterium]